MDAETITTATANVIADTPTGREDRTVVVDAHLDSVDEGPGINENGSGTSAILETALQMAELGIEPVNRVRFAFWGAEEDGLIGSQYYVDHLPKRDLKDIALNLNHDMVGSPNFRPLRARPDVGRDRALDARLRHDQLRSQRNRQGVEHCQGRHAVQGLEAER